MVDKTISPPKVSFEVRTGKGKALDGTVNRRGAVCLCCDTPVAFDHVRAEGRAGRMQAQLMAVVAEGQHGRVYLSPTRLQVAIASKDKPKWRPEAALPHNPRDFKTPNYGINTFADLFTPRQLVALTTFSELINKIRDVIEQDALTAGLACDNVPLSKGGMGAKAYAEAVALYLSLAMDKGADYWSSICSWHSGRDTIRNTFARQAIPMNWDYAEGNPFSDSTGNWVACVNWVVEAVANAPAGDEGSAQQADATSFLGEIRHALFSTDPPYYDNIGYADLADFFYIWLRHNLKDIYPELFRTMLTPKNEELVATPYRFGGSKDKAKEHFERGLQKTFHQMCQKADPYYPLTVYYAFKQAENSSSADMENGSRVVASTGWETMLTGLVTSGFQITGTWPMRTELSNRPVASGTNALASSIVLVCRPRPEESPVTTRR